MAYQAAGGDSNRLVAEAARDMMINKLHDQAVARGLINIQRQ